MSEIIDPYAYPPQELNFAAAGGGRRRSRPDIHFVMCGLPNLGRAVILPVMSFEFAYRFKQDAPPSDLRDLDRVALLTAAISDDGDDLAVGAEGTIVSIFNDGEAYVVEFSAPEGAIATVLPNDLRLVERFQA